MDEMKEPEQLAILQTELERWRQRGLIDDATFQRLRADCLARATDEPAADPAPSLEDEVEAEAARVAAGEQADDTPGSAPARSMDEELEAEAGLHTELAAQAETAARAEIEERIVERDAPRAALRPLLLANAPWLAGALLIIAGSIYFLRLAWDQLSSVPLHVVIAGALHAYAAAFFGVGYLLCRKRDAHAVGRILFAFACGILPLGSVAVGELAHVAVAAWGGAGVAVAALAAVIALALQGLILAVVAGLYERAAMRLMITCGLGLGLLLMSARLVDMLLGHLAPGVPAPVALVPLGFAVLSHGFLGLPRHRVLLRMSILLLGGAMLWAFLVLVVRAQLLAPIAGTHYAALLAALAALLVVTDGRLLDRSSEDGRPRLNGFGLAFHIAALAALAVALAGLGARGYLDLWARVNVLACALVATALFARGAWRFGRRLMTFLAAGTGLLAYFFLPAPFSALLLLAQDWITSTLGYQHEPLPVAFYGLIFLPYLAAVIGLACWLRRRRPEPPGQPRVDIARDLELFTITLGAALVLLAMAGRGDLRPMLWTWPIYAAAAFAGAPALERPLLRHAGHAITVAWLGVAAHWLWPQHSPAPLLAAYGAASALALVRWPAAHHLLFGAASGSLAAIVIAIVPLEAAMPWPGPAALVLTAALLALAAGLVAGCRRWALCAHAASVLALLTSMAACDWAQASRHAVFVVLLAHAVACAAGAHALRRAASDDTRWRLIARPAILGALLALLVAWEPAMFVHVYLAPLAIAAVLAHLAWIGRGAITMLVAALGVACAGAIAIEGLGADLWPLALGGLGCVYLVLAARFPPAWPAARRRLLTLAAAGAGVLGVGLLSCLLASANHGNDPAWWWRATAELVALAIVGAWLWWRAAFWQPLWARTWPVAVLVASQTGAITLATVLSTGRHPTAAVMALLAPAALAAALGLDRVAHRLRARRDVASVAGTARFGLVIAAALATASIVGCMPATPAFVQLLGLATLAAVALVLILTGVREATAWRGYMALIAASVAYVLARAATPLAAAGPALDGAVILVAGHLAFWLSRRLPAGSRVHVLRAPLQAAALAWPLASPWLMVALGPAARCVLGALVACHYIIVARVSGNRDVWPLAIGVGTATLLLGWAAMGWSDTLLYAVPVAFSALLLVHIYAPELSRQSRHALRILVLGALYVMALGQAMSQATPVQALVVVPLLCVTAIVAGTMLRVRAYALMGVLFLAADLGANLLRYGLQSRVLGALFLTVLGLLIVAGMIYFSLERERLLRRYSAITGTLRAWD